MGLYGDGVNEKRGNDDGVGNDLSENRWFGESIVISQVIHLAFIYY